MYSFFVNAFSVLSYPFNFWNFDLIITSVSLFFSFGFISFYNLFFMFKINIYNFYLTVKGRETTIINIVAILFFIYVYLGVFSQGVVLAEEIAEEVSQKPTFWDNNLKNSKTQGSVFFVVVTAIIVWVFFNANSTISVGATVADSAVPYFGPSVVESSSSVVESSSSVVESSSSVVESSSSVVESSSSVVESSSSVVESSSSVVESSSSVVESSSSVVESSSSVVESSSSVVESSSSVVESSSSVASILKHSIAPTGVELADSVLTPLASLGGIGSGLLSGNFTGQSNVPVIKEGKQEVVENMSGNSAETVVTTFSEIDFSNPFSNSALSSNGSNFLRDFVISTYNSDFSEIDISGAIYVIPNQFLGLTIPFFWSMLTVVFMFFQFFNGNVVVAFFSDNSVSHALSSLFSYLGAASEASGPILAELSNLLSDPIYGYFRPYFNLVTGNFRPGSQTMRTFLVQSFETVRIILVKFRRILVILQSALEIAQKYNGSSHPSFITLRGYGEKLFRMERAVAPLERLMISIFKELLKMFGQNFWDFPAPSRIFKK